MDSQAQLPNDLKLIKAIIYSRHAQRTVLNDYFSHHIDKDDRSEPWIGTGGGHISAKGGADAVEFGRRLLGDYSHLLGDTKVIRVRPRSTKKKRCMDTMERILTGMEGANLCNIVTEEIETRKESNESLTMDIAEQAPLLRAFFNRWWDYMRDTHDDSEKMNQLNQEMQEYKLPKHRDIRIGIKNELKPGHVVDVYQVCKAHGVEPPEVFGRWHEYTSRLLMEVWYGPLLFLKTARRLLLGRALGEMRHEIDQMPEKDVAEILVNICHDSAVTALLLYFRVYDITRDEWVPCLDNVRVELFQSTCDPEARFVRLGHGNVVLKVPGCGASHPECPEMCGLREFVKLLDPCATSQKQWEDECAHLDLEGNLPIPENIDFTKFYE